jgi:hypothetical protein
MGLPLTRLKFAALLQHHRFMHQVPTPVGTDLHDRAMATFEDAADCIAKANSFISSITASYCESSFSSAELARLLDMTDHLKLAAKALRQ